MRRLPLAGAFAVATCVAVTVLQWRLVPSLAPDAGLGIVSVQQYLRGLTPSLTDITLADPQNPARDRTLPITWWRIPDDEVFPRPPLMIAPGHQALVYAASGARAVGDAVFTIVQACWLVGIVAWAGYILRVTASRPLAWVLVGGFALFRMSHTSSYVYLGGETPLWAVYPIVVLINLVAVERRIRALAAAGGFSAMWLLALKPSAAFLIAAIAIWHAVLWARKAAPLPHVAAWATGAIVGWLTGVALGMMPGSPTAAGANSAFCVPNAFAVTSWAAGGWLMGLSDLAAAVESAGRALPPLWGAAPPSARLWLPEIAVGALSLVLLLTVVVALRRGRLADAATPRGGRDALLLAVITVVVVAAGVALMQFRGACVSFEGRHHQYGAFLALPFLASALSQRLRSHDPVTRAIALLASAVLFVLPAAYGTAALADKVFVRMPARERTVGPDGLRRDWLPPGADAERFDASLREALGGRMLVFNSAVLCLPYVDQRQLLAWNHPVSAVPDAGLGVLFGPDTSDQHISAALRLLPQVSEWELTRLCEGCPLVALSTRLR